MGQYKQVGEGKGRLAIALGAIATLAVMSLYAFGLIRRGRADIARSLLYNVPVAFMFLTLLAHMVLSVVQGPKAFVAARWPLLLSWCVGSGFLYLRLVEKNIEISGHMVWLPLLLAHAWVERLPSWFLCVGFMSTLAALWMKIAVFGGPSGIPGTLVGCLLGTLVAISTGRRTAGASQSAG